MARRILNAIDDDVISGEEAAVLSHLYPDGASLPVKDGVIYPGTPIGRDGEPVEGLRVVGNYPAVHDFSKFAARAAMEAKVVLGYDMRDTPANRLVVQDWIYRKLASRNVRLLHISKVLPLAVNMVFLNTSYELEVKAAMSSPEIRARIQAAGGGYLGPLSRLLVFLGFLREASPLPAAR